MNLQRYLVAICLFVIATTLSAQTSANCDSIQEAKGFPEYYCDCKEGYTNFRLPIDTVVSYQPIWYKGWLSDLYDGLSAYLHSDCNLNFEVYTSCTALSPKYQAVFTKNEASTIDGESLKRKLEENNVSNVDMAFYICISPMGGEGGRLIMRRESDGIPSSCEDPLYVFPGMTLLTTQTEDVYAVNPNDMPANTDIIFQWRGNNNATCNLQVARGTCDGAVMDQVELLSAEDVYTFTAETIRQAKEMDEHFFLHFNHAPNTSGLVCCLTPEYEDYYIDTLVCQGMGLQLPDTLLTESTIYPLDTVHVSANLYQVNYYNLTIYEPDPQYITLPIKTTELPFNYRDQHTLTDFGQYELPISTEGQCDELIFLTLTHDIDTIITVVDTFLCYGATFSYNGRNYQYDTSFGSSSLKNADTLLIDSLNVYFATSPEVVYDTLQIAKGGSIRKYGKTFREFGDYEIDYIDPSTMCQQKIYVHVKEKINVTLLDSVVETLCQGLEYDYYGTIYTTSVSFRDTFWMNSNTCEVTPVKITFIEPEGQPDTLSLRSTDLPYTYRNQHTITTYGDYDLTIHLDGECDERYLLHVSHAIDTLTQSLDTTLCQGMVYLHKGVEYTTAATFVDSTWMNDDTFALTTVSVTFLAPETQNDTLSLRSTDLPYTYRNQHTITTYGDYDLTIHLDGECDERYLLHVAHDIDTLTQSIDTTLCQGKVYLYNEVEYTSSTAFVDSTWLNADTYSITSVTVTFLAPEAVSDTLSLKSTDLPYTYRNQHTITTYGDYDLTIHVDGECDERYLLHVSHAIDTLTQSLDTTLCQGMVYLHKGVEYTTATTFVDSAWVNDDTFALTTVSVTFLAPETQNDTLSLRSTDLPYTYRNQHTITTYGDYDLTIHVDGECDERYLLHVSHAIDTLTQSLDTTLCQGMVYLHNGVEYTTAATFVDSAWVNDDTFALTTVFVTFLAPETQNDTLSLRSIDLPYTYRNQHTITTYGDYDLTIHVDGECDERYLLHVSHTIDTLTQSLDTTLCYGGTFEYAGEAYVSDTVVVRSEWSGADTLMIDTIRVSFALVPDQVYDTVAITPAELPYYYYEQLVPDFGDYEFMLYNEYGCLEQVFLHVLRTTTTDMPEQPIVDRPRLLMRDGIVYILRASEVFTLLGEKVE